MTELVARCDQCFGLCCVALTFAKADHFPSDSAAGDPCDHLAVDDTCRIHIELTPRGLTGCTAFDCMGAGQKVSRGTFGGRSWREDESRAARMFAVFPVVRRLFELLWYLEEADERVGGDSWTAAAARVHALVDGSADDLLALDVDAEFDRVRPLLIEASEIVRAGVGDGSGSGSGLGPGRDLAGARLAGRDLRGVCLRGSLAVGADLSGALLDRCDLLGVDLRGANLCGADLSGALFVTRMQIAGARGDARTRLPSRIERPSYWSRG